MTLFAILDDKKRMLRSAGKSKVFSLLTMNGNVLAHFVTSYQYVKLIVIYFSLVDNLHSLQTLHSKLFLQHLYPHFMMHCPLSRYYIQHGASIPQETSKAAINAATAKLEEYYSKTASSDAHVIAMSTSRHYV